EGHLVYVDNGAKAAILVGLHTRSRLALSGGFVCVGEDKKGRRNTCWGGRCTPVHRQAVGGICDRCILCGEGATDAAPCRKHRSIRAVSTRSLCGWTA